MIAEAVVIQIIDVGRGDNTELIGFGGKIENRAAARQYANLAAVGKWLGFPATAAEIREWVRRALPP